MKVVNNNIIKLTELFANILVILKVVKHVKFQNDDDLQLNLTNKHLTP